MKLAYFSPLGPQRSGIADYSEELLPHLATEAEVTLFVDGFKPTNNEIASLFEIVDYRTHPESLKQLQRFDAVVYHMGNDHRYHAGIFEAMLMRPGIVVLHDFALQEFFLGLAHERRRPEVYLDEVEFGHGKKTRDEAAEALKIGATPSIVSRPLEFPLNNRIIREAEGLIVHSEWARERLLRRTAGVPVAHIPMPLKFDENKRREASTSQEVRIASFGLVIPGKGIERTLRALSNLRNTHRFRYTLVGEPNPYFDVRELIHHHGMDELVDITGHITLEEFKQKISETDIALNIRERTVGETSASLCRLMAGGVCSIVSDAGWYSELPDDCVVKVPLDGCADKLLLAYLERLIEDASLRIRIGENARRYAVTTHAPQRGAAAYFSFIQQVINKRVRRDTITAVSDELVQLGINSADGPFLKSVADAISGIVPNNNISSNAMAAPVVSSNGNQKSQRAITSDGRTPKVAGIDYKQAAKEYLGLLSEERRHHLRTKPFYNLANKPAKYRNEGMEEDMHRHFCDFANMAVTLALPAGSRILDVGCGSGWLSEYFARLGYVVRGIDISPDLIEMSRERVARVPYGADHETPLRCVFQVHDVELSPLAETFDAIICYDSMHHFEDDRAVMRNLAEMLNVGGVLFILEGERPASDSAGEAELRAVMDEFRTLESPFDYDYLRKLLDENGFAIVGDYVSINGLFERALIDDGKLPPRTLSTGYHYLSCKKVAAGRAASTVPHSSQPGQLRARFNLLTAPAAEFPSGGSIEVDLEIANAGDTLWLTAPDPRPGIVMPALLVFDAAGLLVSETHGEPALPRPVAPGETVNLKIVATAPNEPGAYTLKIDLVAEHICWFEQQGSAPLTIQFKVV
jgi:2-polyprenyl-3-methyl-5-hydroxy-6-metoxy-1,4-benzoquinol methylase/glycosyltransferase involved in cell wall biosynthesis